MKKRFVWSMLATALVTSSLLTGCASSSASEDDKTKLTVWAMGDEGKRLPELINQFNSENDSIEVVVQAIPWDQAHDKLLTAVASGQGPDVVQMGTSWMPEFADAGILANLDEYIAKYPNLEASNFYDGALQSTKFENATVGIPWYIETRVLYYRTDLAAEAGYPNGPATWEDLLDLSTKLANRGDKVYGISMDLKDQFFSTVFAWQNGWEFNEESPKFNTPEFIETVNYLKQYYDQNLTPKMNDLDLVASFKEGILPMYISGPWMLKPMNDADLGDTWAVTTLPAKETNTSFMGGSNLVVFENSKNKDEAVEFINYMVTPETQLKWLEIADCLPSAKIAWENDVLAKNKNLAVFGEQLNSANSTPMLKEWETIAQDLNRSLEKIFVGNEKVETVLSDLDAQIAKMMKK